MGGSNCYAVRVIMMGREATVAVTGASGMLGQEVCASAPDWATVVALTRADGDLSVPEQARQAIISGHPQIVVHCAAYTHVDGATEDPEAARLGNEVAARNVAAACGEIGARLLFVSTDYVFDGASERPYTEDAEPSPVNVYGCTKLAAEQEAAKLERHLIVRTQWLFGPGGRNFVESILNAARAGKSLGVVQDEVGHPTYAPDLAGGLWRLLETPAEGIVHLTNAGVCSRLDLAQAALEEAGLDQTEVRGIASSEWPSPTRRPLHAVLESTRLEGLGIAPLRHWREALAEYVLVLIERWQEQAIH
jgi:dTDP-4-dehydrorhamnose reductase